MSVTSMNRIELHLKTRIYDRGLASLLRRYGVDVQVVRSGKPTSSVSTQYASESSDDLAATMREVYGVDAGMAPDTQPPAEGVTDLDPSTDVRFSARILIGAATYQVADEGQQSDFDENYVYSKDELRAGDRIVLTTEEGNEKQLLIRVPEKVGFTQAVHKRWAVSPLEV